MLGRAEEVLASSVGGDDEDGSKGRQADELGGAGGGGRTVLEVLGEEGGSRGWKTMTDDSIRMIVEVGVGNEAAMGRVKTGSDSEEQEEEGERSKGGRLDWRTLRLMPTSFDENLQDVGRRVKRWRILMLERWSRREGRGLRNWQTTRGGPGPLECRGRFPSRPSGSS